MRPLAITVAALLAFLALTTAAPAAAHPGKHRSHAGRVHGAAKIGSHRRLSRKHLSRQPRPAANADSTPAANVSEGIPLPAAAPSPDILFQSNFEAGFEGWHVQAPSGRAQVVSGDSFSGEDNARFEVREGDVEPETGSSRAEVSGPTFDEGQDLFIADAIRIPTANTFNGPWQIIQQLHENDWGGSPGIAVFLDTDRQIHIGAGDGSPTYWEGPRLQTERWYELVYRVHLSRDPAQGFVEVWLDGAPQTLVNGSERAYGQTIQTESTYLKAGIYRSKSSTGTSVVEHDKIVVGTSLAAVLGS